MGPGCRRLRPRPRESVTVEVVNKVNTLAVLSNAVLVWNMARMTESYSRL